MTRKRSVAWRDRNGTNPALLSGTRVRCVVIPEIRVGNGKPFCFDSERSGFKRDPFLRRTTGSIGKQVPGSPTNNQRPGGQVIEKFALLSDPIEVAVRYCDHNFFIGP